MTATWSFEPYFYALVLDRTSSGPQIPGALLRNQPEDHISVNYPDVFRWHSWYAIQNGLPIVRYLSHVWTLKPSGRFWKKCPICQKVTLVTFVTIMWHQRLWNRPRLRSPRVYYSRVFLVVFSMVTSQKCLDGDVIIELPLYLCSQKWHFSYNLRLGFETMGSKLTQQWNMTVHVFLK